MQKLRPTTDKWDLTEPKGKRNNQPSGEGAYRVGETPGQLHT